MKILGKCIICELGNCPIALIPITIGIIVVVYLMSIGVLTK